MCLTCNTALTNVAVTDADSIAALVQSFDLNGMFGANFNLEKITTTFMCGNGYCDGDMYSRAYHDERNARIHTRHRVATYLRTRMGWTIPLGIEFFIACENVSRDNLSIANNDFLDNYDEYLTLDSTDGDGRTIHFMICSTKLHDAVRENAMRTENALLMSKLLMLENMLALRQIPEPDHVPIPKSDRVPIPKSDRVPIPEPDSVPIPEPDPVTISEPDPVTISEPNPKPNPKPNPAPDPNSNKVYYHMLNPCIKMDLALCKDMLSKKLVRSYADIDYHIKKDHDIIMACIAQRIFQINDLPDSSTTTDTEFYAIQCINAYIITKYEEVPIKLRNSVNVVRAFMNRGPPSQ